MFYSCNLFLVLCRSPPYLVIFDNVLKYRKNNFKTVFKKATMEHSFNFSVPLWKEEQKIQNSKI